MVVGCSYRGFPIVVEEEIFEAMLESLPVSRSPKTLFQAYVEMFPELSKTEIRRLIRGGAARGYLANITLGDAEAEEYEGAPMIAKGWPKFYVIRLGKTPLFGYRFGILIP